MNPFDISNVPVAAHARKEQDMAETGKPLTWHDADRLKEALLQAAVAQAASPNGLRPASLATELMKAFAAVDAATVVSSERPPSSAAQ